MNIDIHNDKDKHNIGRHVHVCPNLKIIERMHELIHQNNI